MNSNFFKNHESKLKLEAIIKSILCGLAVGFGANFVAALVTWFLPVNGIWISIVALAAVALISAPVFYFARFRPTDVTSARRIDRMGLEERLITMVEYENDDSYIAKLQREDAKRALASVDKKQIRIKISKAIVATVEAFTMLGAGMTTVNALGELGYLPSGDEIVDSVINESTKYVTILYVVEEGGMIDGGDEEQIIVLGTNGDTVTAVADDGYMFDKWSDGVKSPTRTEINVTEDIIITAEFVLVEEDGDGESGNGDQGDMPSDRPGDQESQEGEGNGNPSDGPPSHGLQGGGKSEPNNQIINGEIYYRDPSTLEQYQDAADERTSADDSGYSDDEIDLIKKYLGIV